MIMGWLYTHKPRGIKPLDYLINHSGALRWGDDNPHTYKVLDAALVNLRTAYFAVEQVHKETGERRVWAAIFLLGYAPKDHHNFGWKDMDESCGPCEAQCPERILKLLTPTEYEHAKDWRQRCWERIEKRRAMPKIVPGAIVTLYRKDYEVQHRYGARSWQIRSKETGQVYRLSDVKARQCTSIIPPTTTETPNVQ